MNNVLKLTRHLIVPLIVCAATAVHAQNPLPPDKVLVSNSRASVAYREFEAELARIPVNERYEIQLSREKTAMLLDNLLTNKTLALEARANKLDELPLVKAEIANQTEKVLAKYRGQQVQNELPKADLLPRARERYLTSPEKFIKPAQYDSWHVLINLKGRTLEQANARAKEVKDKLLAGETREKLAEEYSDDPSVKMNQGNIGLYNVDAFDPLYAAALKNMKLGEVTIVQSSYGVHVTKLLDYKPSARVSFDAVKTSLLQDAETEYIVSAWNNYLRKITSDPKVFVDVDALESIRPKLPAIPGSTANEAPLPTAAATPAPVKP